MKVAAVDIGTNTVRLLLADVVRGEHGARIVNPERHEIITRLGEGLDATGRLGDEPIERALAGLSHYSDLIGGASVERRAGVATAATRSADNGADFIVRVADVLDFQPRVIDGVEEARLTFAGATNALAGDEALCVIDVGGGSTEFVAGTDLPDYAVSIDIGSVRLTERIKSIPLRDPQEIRAHVDRLIRDVQVPYPLDLVLGSGGTFVTLAAVHLGLATKRLEFQEGTLSLSDLRMTVDRLLQMTVAEIAELPAVVAGRAGVLQAGAICAERAITHIGLAELTISVSDILDGLALETASPTT
ncbi:MAG: exopolyphosphatase [Actinomycetota bacterium]|nr:exopolyphosphatase [Actinomycetota bacterium]